LGRVSQRLCPSTPSHHQQTHCLPCYAAVDQGVLPQKRGGRNSVPKGKAPKQHASATPGAAATVDLTSDAHQDECIELDTDDQDNPSEEDGRDGDPTSAAAAVTAAAAAAATAAAAGADPEGRFRHTLVAACITTVCLMACQ